MNVDPSEGMGSGAWRRENGTRLRRVSEPRNTNYPPFTILTGSDVSATPMEWEWHSHPVHELVWVRNGTLTARVGQRVFTVPDGFGLWVPAGTMHAGRFTAHVEFHEAVFNPEHSSSTFTDTTDTTVVVISPLLQSLLTHLASANLPPDERARAESVVFDVLEPTEQEISLQLPGDERIDPIAQALLADPSDQRSLAQWSRSLHISARTLARTFRSSTGLSFTTWRQALRIHHALRLLSSGFDVQDTSDSLGYANPSTFIAAFRRVMGTTPGRFQGKSGHTDQRLSDSVHQASQTDDCQR